MDTTLKQKILGVIVLLALIGICLSVLLHRTEIAHHRHIAFQSAASSEPIIPTAGWGPSYQNTAVAQEGNGSKLMTPASPVIASSRENNANSQAAKTANNVTIPTQTATSASASQIPVYNDSRQNQAAAVNPNRPLALAAVPTASQVHQAPAKNAPVISFQSASTPTQQATQTALSMPKESGGASFGHANPASPQPVNNEASKNNHNSYTQNTRIFANDFKNQGYTQLSQPLTAHAHEQQKAVPHATVFASAQGAQSVQAGAATPPAVVRKNALPIEASAAPIVLSAAHHHSHHSPSTEPHHGHQSIAGSRVVQVGSFNVNANAQALVAKLHAAGFAARAQKMHTVKGEMTRVVVGSTGLDKAQAEILVKSLQQKMQLSGFVTPLYPNAEPSASRSAQYHHSSQSKISIAQNTKNKDNATQPIILSRAEG